MRRAIVQSPIENSIYPTLLANIGPGWKCLVMTNALAYHYGPFVNGPTKLRITTLR
jgi:hypothetical protein